MLRSELMTTAPQRVLHIPYHRVYPVECRMIQQIKVAPGDNTQVLTIGLLDRFETGQSIGYHRATTREGANKSYGTRAFNGNPLILND
ncbi:hypothetical protein KAM472_21900 [Aeromonas caviae]|nr:hypothetical protein KAM462_09760 [Aeromonas caviae]GKR40494.1 hypothetical protein KAM472_21900 [Aeromonas caviae]GKR48524.1 hypothetical protein KAM474_19420 [Aeromonas caviae]GKR58530.1 hypothetical protein KAM476_33950 [Aeromonas caviae]GKR62690.1 hypothetical protein KAM477_33120 [Aeromonas caviae]